MIEIVSNERNGSIKITGGQQTEEKKHNYYSSYMLNISH